MRLLSGQWSILRRVDRKQEAALVITQLESLNSVPNAFSQCEVLLAPEFSQKETAHQGSVSFVKSGAKSARY